MATYRIYYVEHTPKDTEDGPPDPEELLSLDEEDFEDTEWEETYDGGNSSKALAGFFDDHAPTGEVQIVEEDGGLRDVGGNEGFDPDRTYLWIEEGHLMEYQGMEESTPGLVACPMCDGTGEVPAEVAEDYAASTRGDVPG
jgi:hypothetical protein